MTPIFSVTSSNLAKLFAALLAASACLDTCSK
jgi:hypothetical protein